MRPAVLTAALLSILTSPMFSAHAEPAACRVMDEDGAPTCRIEPRSRSGREVTWHKLVAFVQRAR